MKIPIKYIMSAAIVFMAGSTPVLAAAGKSAQANNARIVEDTLWLAAFLMMSVLGRSLMKMTKGGFKGIYQSYLILFLASISGLVWKGLGFVSRVAVISEPKWLFAVTREVFEGLTGILIGISFLFLLLSLTRKDT